MQEDALLIKRAQKGDAEAFEALMTPLEKRIYALCLRMLTSREDALDCAQDTMLRIWRALGTYRMQSSFSTWALRIATNACLDMLRKRKNKPTTSLDALVDVGFAPQAEPEGSPETQAENADQRDAIKSAIAILPEDMRSALILRDVQGMAYEEVADVLQAPLGTIKSRINRARARVREKLTSTPEPFFENIVYADERRKDV